MLRTGTDDAAFRHNSRRQSGNRHGIYRIDPPHIRYNLETFLVFTAKVPSLRTACTYDKKYPVEQPFRSDGKRRGLPRKGMAGTVQGRMPTSAM